MSGDIMGNVFSEEHKRKISESIRNKWKDPIYAAKACRGRKGRKHSREWVLRCVEGRKGYVPSEETKKKNSEAHKGRKKPEGFGEKIRTIVTGKKYSEEHNRKLSLALTGRKVSEETRKKMLRAAQRRKGWRHSEETKERLRKPKPEGFGEKIRRSKLELWQDPVWREKQLKAVFKGLALEPNKPEKFLTKLLNELLPGQYKYVGDGSILIGYKNPDFININNQKKLIELFGNFWHSEKRTGRTKIEEENQRINHFAKYGYQTLIIWESELKDIDSLKEKLFLW